MAARIQTLEWLNQRIDELERRNLMLSIIARRPLSGWQKAEAAAEIRRAERLFNENCTLRLRITELEALLKSTSTT